MAGANKRVTELTVLSTPTNNDVLPIVDVLDTTQDPTGSLKQITWASIKVAILAFFSAASPITYSGGVFGFDPTANITFTHATLSSPIVNTPTVTSPTVNVGSDATGDILYRNSGGLLARLGIGSAGQYLGVTAGLPAWGTPGIPSGTISMFGGASAPTNWLLCDGTAVSRTTYASLFAAVSTTYGVGNGSTTFNIPDFRGRVGVGKNAGTFSSLAATGGEETHVLTTPETPSHTHTGYGPNTTGGATHDAVQTIAANAVYNTASSSVGGDGAHNNLQPYLTINFIIAI